MCSHLNKEWKWKALFLPEKKSYWGKGKGKDDWLVGLGLVWFYLNSVAIPTQNCNQLSQFQVPVSSLSPCLSPVHSLTLTLHSDRSLPKHIVVLRLGQAIRTDERSIIIIPDNTI